MDVRGLARGLGMGPEDAVVLEGVGVSVGLVDRTNVVVGAGGFGLAGFAGPFSSINVEGAQPSRGPIFTNHHPSSFFSSTSTLTPSAKLMQPSVLPA